MDNLRTNLTSEKNRYLCINDRYLYETSNQFEFPVIGSKQISKTLINTQTQIRSKIYQIRDSERNHLPHHCCNYTRKIKT